MEARDAVAGAGFHSQQAAGRPVGVVDPRVERRAGLEAIRAARREVAARGHVERVGHRALDDVEPLPAHPADGIEASRPSV